jgi:hypothetical protein
MRDRIKAAMTKYANPQYLKWLLFFLSLIGLVLGAGAPDGYGTGGGGP